MKSEAKYLGGHADLNFRDVFDKYIVEHQEYNLDDSITIDEETKITLNDLIGQLWKCTDITSRDICQKLGLGTYAKYSQVVRKLKSNLLSRE